MSQANMNDLLSQYYNYVQPTQEEMDQQEADYYGITVDELRNFRQQQLGFNQPTQDQLPPPTDAAGDSPYVSGITQPALQLTQPHNNCCLV